MINRVILVGRLTKDPELRYTTSNTPVVSFTVAVSRPFVNQGTGEREADFIPVVLWRKQAENVKKFLTKGSLCGVEGRIQTRTYDDQSGVRHYVTEVLADNVYFLDSKNQNQDTNLDFSQPQENKKSDDDDDEFKYSNVKFSENDVPF
ncbi:MAG: single-stranded DNA-binding protein [Gammaproteobacteria bacterium]|nr:single-stranded DNA-binding protein [Gammaproteobacteria bacterium]